MRVMLSSVTFPPPKGSEADWNVRTVPANIHIINPKAENVMTKVREKKRLY
jgi:hypothetical protein